MVSKKSSPEPSLASMPKRPANLRPRTFPRGGGDVDLGQPPETDDPTVQAGYFMQLLEVLDQSGDPEARKLRTELIEFVSEYAKLAEVDKAQAKIMALTRMTTFEISVSEFMLRATRQVTKLLAERSRRLGTASAQGKTVRAAAEGFGGLVEALELMLESAHKQDVELRNEAYRRLEKVKGAVEALKL